ncbi:hypothetical protein [Pontibacter cellulosilyticus]|uniref:Uncharacterized protein n=1 Tax=Pontibacter cellulosilyticus TaxID=1720253 RepID=A0A923N629_9BACT|nr:hypothetical protein [Pontibacter cellulosilyticus]MBC5993298.1 hypothetical protein [Pontibacter cellulosilyticus]
MNKITAVNILLWLIAAITVFHLSILLKLVPYEITWGGRLKSEAEMYAFESISIAVNLFLGFVLMIKGGYVRQILPLKMVNAILWIFLVIFTLNTIGNIVAETYFEKFFALVTVSFSILIWVILNKGKKQETHGKTHSV